VKTKAFDESKLDVSPGYCWDCLVLHLLFNKELCALLGFQEELTE